MSEMERVSWVSLVVSLAIGWWYFSHVFALPAGTDLFGAGIAKFALNMIILSIFAGIASELVLRYTQRRSQGEKQNETALDERDVLIDLKSTRNAYMVLIGCILLLLGQVTLIEWTTRSLARRGRPLPEAQTVWDQILSGPLTAPMLVHLLLLALTLSGIAVYISRIVQYRRG